MTVFVVLINGEVDKVFLDLRAAAKYCDMVKRASSVKQAWNLTKIVEKDLIGSEAYQ